VAKDDEKQARGAGAGGQAREARSQERRGEGEEAEEDGQVNVLDGSADTHLYMADVGYTVTSHGDGTPSISPQLVARREELKAINANPDAGNEALAEQLNQG
jgi:hypothetical protein